MAFTSEWVWGNISRNNDLVVVDGAYGEKGNWSMTRSRWSNDAYSSDLGDWELSLSAKNGGVTETITSPLSSDAYGLKFSASTAWTLSGYIWDELTGATAWGKPVYKLHPIYQGLNIPDPDKFNYLMLIAEYAAPSSNYWQWAMVELDDEFSQISDDELFFTDLTNYCYSTNRYGFAASPPPAGTLDTPEGDALTQNVGTFTGDATAGTIGQQTLPLLYCTADVQSYPTPSVDWYLQTQTWIFKDEFSLTEPL